MLSHKAVGIPGNHRRGRDRNRSRAQQGAVLHLLHHQPGAMPVWLRFAGGNQEWSRWARDRRENVMAKIPRAWGWGKTDTHLRYGQLGTQWTRCAGSTPRRDLSSELMLGNHRAKRDRAGVAPTRLDRDADARNERLGDGDLVNTAAPRRAAFLRPNNSAAVSSPVHPPTRPVGPATAEGTVRSSDTSRSQSQDLRVGLRTGLVGETTLRNHSRIVDVNMGHASSVGGTNIASGRIPTVGGSGPWRGTGAVLRSACIVRSIIYTM